MESNHEYYLNLSKTFPFFLIWHDSGDESPCEGNDHVRSLDEAYIIAETRALYSGFNGVATIYKGILTGSAKAIRRYKWKDRKVVYEDLKRP